MSDYDNWKLASPPDEHNDRDAEVLDEPAECVECCAPIADGAMCYRSKAGDPLCDHCERVDFYTEELEEARAWLLRAQLEVMAASAKIAKLRPQLAAAMVKP